MADYKRILDFAPVPTNRVNVRVAHATVVNPDCDVFRAKRPALELKDLQRTRRRIPRHPFCRIRAGSLRRGLGKKGTRAPKNCARTQDCRLDEKLSLGIVDYVVHV